MYNEKVLWDIWDSIKDDISFRKEIDRSKLLKQLELTYNCLMQGVKSWLECCTRFGKTIIGIILIKRMNLKFPDNSTIVIVPTINLLNDWIGENGHIQTFNLKNVEVYVVNSFVLTGIKYKCDFLILDEAHRYSNIDSQYFSKILDNTSYKYVLALSATLDNAKKEFLSSYGLKSAGKVTLQEAEMKGWVAKHSIYNLGINFENEYERIEYKKWNDIHNSNFAKFDFNWEYASACKLPHHMYYKSSIEGLNMTGSAWRNIIAQKNGWSPSLGDSHEFSPKNLFIYAQQWNLAVRERKNLLNNNDKKLLITKEVIEYINRPTLIFSESTKFADDLSMILDNCSSYHSKVQTKVYSDKSFTKVVAIALGDDKFEMIKSKEILSYKQVKMKFKNACKVAGANLKLKILKDFNSGVIDRLSTVKALNEGLDSDRAEIGVIASGNSKVLDSTQRMGRSLNFVEGKEAIIVNVYFQDTQDEKWLTRRQLNIPSGKIKWITNINEIQI